MHAAAVVAVSGHRAPGRWWQIIVMSVATHDGCCSERSARQRALACVQRGPQQHLVALLHGMQTRHCSLWALDGQRL